MNSRPLEERWREKVQFGRADECWLWTASKTVTGYGKIGVRDQTGRQRTALAHRIAWEIYFGAAPSNLCVCHRCDVKACVNPAHLFLGTVADNNRDMHNKGRGYVFSGRRGSSNGRAKLDEFGVMYLRAMYKAAPFDRRALARRLGVSLIALRSALSGKTWAHVPMP